MQPGRAAAENPARGTTLIAPLRGVARTVTLHPNLFRPLAVLLLLVGMALSRPAGASDAPIVAAASSVSGALEEIGRAYARTGDSQVRLSFGSSGNLARQIMQGAPFELFLSADQRYTGKLITRGLTSGDSEVYAVGRLALFIPDGSSLALDATLEDLDRALNDGRLQRLAMANPEHAPYGRAAREALEKRQLWGKLQNKLLLGENVAQAAQFAGSGNADAGIISASTALVPAIADKGTHVLLPESWHAPLEHHMVLLQGPGPVSRAFHDFILSDESRWIFRRFGFSVPARSP